jgi:hypothetical protein
LATILAAYLATWRPVWRPPWWSGVAAASLAATAAVSCRSGTKYYTTNFRYLRSLPVKFQVSRLEIAACSVEQTHTHTHTNKVHFELKVKSHYVRQLFIFGITQIVFHFFLFTEYILISTNISKTIETIIKLNV